MRRQQKARQRWGKAIEKVRKRVREERARGERGDAAASTSQDESERAGEAGPSKGRGAQRSGRVADGAYREARQTYPVVVHVTVISFKIEKHKHEVGADRRE